MAAQRDLLVNIVERKEGNALTAVATDLDKLSRGVDASGNAMRDMESDAKKLNAEIEKSSARIKDLHRQFAATGDTSLFGDIRKEETRLRNLKKTVSALAPDIAKAGEDVGAMLGVSVTDSFNKQLSGAFSGQGGVGGMGALGAAILGAAPSVLATLGAMISGAVVGAVGTGGIVGGVLAASHNSQVKAAFGALLEDVKTQFFAAGSSFVGPVLSSVGILDKAFHNLDLAKTFALAAPDLTVIVQGLADLVQNIMPGLNTLLARSPAFAVAAAGGFRFLGESLSNFLDKVSESPGSLEGLRALFIVLAGTVNFLAFGLDVLSRSFHAFNVMSLGFFEGTQKALGLIGVHVGVVDQITDGLHRLIGNTVEATGKVFKFADAIAGETDATREQTIAMLQQNEQLQSTIDLLDNAINTMLSLDNAQLGVSKGWKDLSDAVAENGKHWNDNTDAAFKNRDAILAQIGNLERAREEQIKNGMAVADANAQYLAGVDKVLAYAKALGATKEQLDRIKGSYEINLIVTSALGSAAAQIQKLIPHFASGGDVPGPTGSPMLAVVHGGERVLTPAQQASGGGGQTVQVVMTIDPSGAPDSMGAAMLKFLRDHVRFNGGSADVAFS